MTSDKPKKIPWRCRDHECPGVVGYIVKRKGKLAWLNVLVRVGLPDPQGEDAWIGILGVAKVPCPECGKLKRWEPGTVEMIHMIQKVQRRKVEVSA